MNALTALWRSLQTLEVMQKRGEGERAYIHVTNA
jgi:hypothetical protein